MLDAAGLLNQLEYESLNKDSPRFYGGNYPIYKASPPVVIPQIKATQSNERLTNHYALRYSH